MKTNSKILIKGCLCVKEGVLKFNYSLTFI